MPGHLCDPTGTRAEPRLDARPAWYPRGVLRGERPKRVLVPFDRAKGTPSGKRPHQAGKPERGLLEEQLLSLPSGSQLPLHRGAFGHGMAPSGASPAGALVCAGEIGEEQSPGKAGRSKGTPSGQRPHQAGKPETGVVRRTTPQSASQTAPLTQGSLWPWLCFATITHNILCIKYNIAIYIDFPSGQCYHRRAPPTGRPAQIHREERGLCTK